MLPRPLDEGRRKEDYTRLERRASRGCILFKSHFFRWLEFFRCQKKASNNQMLCIVPRAQHRLSRTNIAKYALKVLYTLHDAGYEAYLVGGGVRDLLLGKCPKDFDVATNARPEEIKRLFRNCRLIGRRFRLAHVHFGKQIVEVTTFRSDLSKSTNREHHLVHSDDGMILRDNVYGTLEEDVFRRDFTVNALYYNIADFSLVDYVDGLSDLKARCLRIIGDPRQRYREDPVRILRAIRFSAKLDFSIHPETEAPIFELGHLIEQVPSARLMDEQIKLFLSGFAQSGFHLLRQYQVFGILFPITERYLNAPKGDQMQAFIESALSDTDQRFREEKPVRLVFLLAVFFWCPVEEKREEFIAEGMLRIPAFYEACDFIFNEQQKTMAISKRLVQGIREIWTLQIRFERRTEKRALKLCAHPKFRLAYDFLLLRAKVGGKEVNELALWWKQYLDSDDEAKQSMVGSLKKVKRYRRRTKKKV